MFACGAKCLESHWSVMRGCTMYSWNRGFRKFTRWAFNKKSFYSLCLDANNFVKFQLCGLITSEPFGGKNPKFIRDSVKQIKNYGYRVKNRSYLRFCVAKSGFLDVNNEKCLFLTREKSTITNFSAKINYTGVKRISWRKY
jgi:hypothetical protein